MSGPIRFGNAPSLGAGGDLDNILYGRVISGKTRFFIEDGAGVQTELALTTPSDQAILQDGSVAMTADLDLGTKTIKNFGGTATGLLYVDSGGKAASTGAMTAGSILFHDGTKPAQNNASLFWDSANLRETVGNAWIYTPGANNLFIGQNAGNLTLSSAGSTAIGSGALTGVTTAAGVTVVGFQAGNGITTAGGQTSIGYQAGFTGGGLDSTNIGYQAGYSGGNSCVAVGALALYSNTARQNVAVGESALQNNVEGLFNVAVGYYCLQANIDGHQNIAAGVLALGSNTHGGNNTGHGDGALQFNTLGNNNSAYGCLAGAGNTGVAVTTGSQNTFLGAFSDLNANNLNYAIAIGYKAVATASSRCVIGGTGAAALTDLGFGSDNATSIGDSASTMRPANIFFGTQCIGPLGSVSAPSFSILGHLTSGLYWNNTSGGFAVSGAGTECMLWSGGVSYATGGIIQIPDTGTLQWSSSGAFSAADLIALRDAAATWALRNGTTSQNLIVYNTWTSATNNEYVKLETGGSYVALKMDKGSGGGSARPLYIWNNGGSGLIFRVGGTEYWKFDSNGDAVLANTGSALATTATSGFPYLPTCAGTPTGTPTARTGAAPAVIDTTNGKLWAYYGGAWHFAALT